MGFQGCSPCCNKGGGHSGKEVVMICLNEECEAKRLCCLVCVDELHRKHELISLYKFQQMLSILIKSSDNDSRGRVVGLLEQFQHQITQRLDHSLRQYQEFIQKNKKKLRGVIGSAKHSVNLQFTQQDIEEVYKQLDNGTVCKYLDLIREAEGEALKDVQQASKTLKNAHSFLDKIFEQTAKISFKGMQDVGGALEKLQKLLDSRGKAFKKLLFSNQYKNAQLEVGGDQRSVKRIDGAGSYPICLLQSPLTEFNNSFTVKLKQQPGNRGCWLGVCAHEIVKTFGYKACYGIGKGTWGIDQVGASHQSAYSWSHHDAAFNSQPKVGWTFGVGDVVTVRVDFQKAVVIFEKGPSCYQMPFQPTLGQIYGYVGCTYIGDMWQIV